MLRKINLIRGIPGKGLYGWGVVGGAFISHFLSYGTLVVAFGIFFPFMASSLGWGRGLLASAVVLGRGTSAVAGPLLGHQVDKHGPRPFVFLGGIALAAGTGLLALVHSPWQLFLAYGLVMGLGAVALGDMTADSTVSKWFVRRRGRAMAFCTMGMSAAGVALPIPLAFLITQLGWRETWVVVGLSIAILASLAAPFMRRRPEDYGMVPDGKAEYRGSPTGISKLDEVSLTAQEALHTPAFWLLVVSTNLASLAIFGINLHLFSYITDKGISVGVAAGAITYLYFLLILPSICRQASVGVHRGAAASAILPGHMLCGRRARSYCLDGSVLPGGAYCLRQRLWNDPGRPIIYQQPSMV